MYYGAGTTEREGAALTEEGPVAEADMALPTLPVAAGPAEGGGTGALVGVGMGAPVPAPGCASVEMLNVTGVLWKGRRRQEDQAAGVSGSGSGGSGGGGSGSGSGGGGGGGGGGRVNQFVRVNEVF